MSVFRLCWQLLTSRRGLTLTFPVEGSSLRGRNQLLATSLHTCKAPVQQRVEIGRMALSSSSSLKAMESPFSHKELYGVEHPLAVKGKRKSKLKHRKSSKSQAVVSGRTSGRRSSSGSGPPRRKSKTSKEVKTSTTTPVSVNNSSEPTQTGKSRVVVSQFGSTSSRDDSLAVVEADSPNALRQRRTDSRWRPLVGSKSSDQISSSWRKEERIGKRGGGVPTSVSAHAASGKPRFSCPVPSISSGVSRLSLSDCEEKLKAGVVSSAVNVRFNRTLTDLNIPPHLRVPRRAFESSAGGLGGRGGGRERGQPDVLTITDVARGLA